MIVVTLIIMATAGSARDPETLSKHYAVPDLMACESLMREQIGAVFHSRPDIISVSGTCTVSMGQDL